MIHEQFEELAKIISEHPIDTARVEVINPQGDTQLVLQGWGFEIVLGDWEGGHWYINDTSGG